MKLHLGRRWIAMIVFLIVSFVLAGVAGAWRWTVLRTVDLDLSRDIQRLRQPWLDRVMESATWLGSAPGLMVIAALAGTILFRAGRRKEALAALLSLLSLPLNIALKLIANRPRPSDPVEVMISTSGSSFPSGHSMGSMAVYGTLSALVWSLTELRTPAIVLAIVPIVVGISRVYLGAHWGYDVMAGWAAGALCAAGVIAWLRGSASPAPSPKEAEANAD